MTAVEPGRRQLGEFLRARRGVLAPEPVGLPLAGQARRVAGLRREEVAQVTNVSTDCYTRLEQGRLPAPSETVLSALIQALRLNHDRARYLRTVASVNRRPGSTSAAPKKVPPEMLVLLENMADLPALVISRLVDVLAWNNTAAALFTDISQVPPSKRNLIQLIFLNDEMRSRFVASVT